MSAQMLSIAQAAAYLGVSKDTLRRWEKQGKVTAERTSGGIRLFHKADLAAIRFPSVLSVSAAAEYLQVSSSTVRRLADSGILPFTKDAKGRRVFLRENLSNQNYSIAKNKPVKQGFPSKFLTTGLFTVLTIMLFVFFILLVPLKSNPESTVHQQISPQQAMVLGDETGNQNIIQSVIASVRRFFSSTSYWFTVQTEEESINAPTEASAAPVPGPMGSTGATGSRGLAGATGASGTAGIDGTDGEKGDRGETGSGGQGATGATGIVGATGAGGTSGDSLFSTNQNLLFPGISSDRSLALGNISNDPSTTSTSSARIFLDGSTGYASISGALTVGNGQAIRSAFGPVQLQYKSGPNAWTTGFYMQDSTGNIGIGTTNPTENLHIFDSGVPEILLDRGFQKGRFFKPASTTTMIGHNINWNGSQYNLDNTGIDGWLMTFGDRVGGTRFDIGYAPDTSTGGLTPTSFFRINGSQGLIGINTTSPASRLDIQGGFAGNSAVTINQTNSGDIFTASSSGTSRFTITNAGNVGIGTTNPSNMLTLGSITNPGSLTFNGPNNTNSTTGSITYSKDLFGADVSGLDINGTNRFNGIRVRSPISGNVYTDISEGVISSRWDGPVSKTMLSLSRGSSVRFSLFDDVLTNNVVELRGGTTNDLAFTQIRNIGINTTTPNSKLDVWGGYGGNSAVTINQTNSGDIFTASSSGTPRFTITNAGNVGIGTTNPSFKLDLDVGNYGNVFRFLQNSTNYFQYSARILTLAASDTHNNSSNLNFLRGGTKIFGIEMGLTNTYGQNIRFLTSEGYEFKVGNNSETSALSAMTLLNTGNIGINTTSPASRLDIQGGYAGNAAVRINQTSSGDIFTASSSGTPRFTITNAGNVGIGTTQPNEALHVEGDARVDDLILGALTSDVVGIHIENVGTAIDISTSNGANRGDLRIDNLGNIGLGTTSPFSRLDVQGGYAGNAAVRINQTNSGDIFTASSSGTPRFTITNAGNVGIGTTNPSTPLHVVASGTGNIATFVSDNNTGCTLSDGGIIACSSDARLKKNIVNVNNSLFHIMKLNPVSFRWHSQNENAPAQIGFLAQEVEAVFPDLVSTAATGFKSLNTTGLVPYLVKAVQEQQQQITSLIKESNQSASASAVLGTIQTDIVQNKINAVEAEISALQTILTLLQKVIAFTENSLRFTVAATFTQPVTFLKEIIFTTMPVYKDPNAAGSAVIPKSARVVDISFTTELATVPLIHVTPQNTNAAFTIENTTTKGFRIALSNAASQENRFTWFVTLAPDAPTFIGNREDEPVPPTAAPTQHISPLPSQTPTPLPSPESEANVDEESVASQSAVTQQLP